MLTLLLVWVGLMAILLVMITRKDRSGVLLLAYCVGLAMIHVAGAINHLGEGIAGFLAEETRIGFEVTLVGIACLLAGAMLARASLRYRPNAKQPVQVTQRLTYRQFGVLFIGIGLFSFFGFAPLTGFIPGLAALSSGVVGLLIVGMWMVISDAMDRGRQGRLGLILGSLLVLPFATLLTGGFLGYGVGWLILIFSLLVINHPKRLWMILAAPLVLYAGMSFAVAYLAEREYVRASLNEEVPLAERLRHVPSMFGRIAPYNWNDPDHAYFIDLRFNQNYLVGLTVDRLNHREIRHELGGTVPLWSLIPRAVWPDKPEVGGGGDIVEEATGLRFDEDSSFGAGQPLEFYLNFGWAGVFIGFMLLGALLMFLDRRISLALRERNIPALVMAGMPGIALIQPGGNLMEILVAFAAAIVASHGIAMLVRFIERGSRTSAGAVGSGVLSPRRR
jgi:uncharacterized membrane protein